MRKIILIIGGEVIVGLSAYYLREIGLWFLIPWVIGWNIYNRGVINNY